MSAEDVVAEDLSMGLSKHSMEDFKMTSSLQRLYKELTPYETHPGEGEDSSVEEGSLSKKAYKESKDVDEKSFTGSVSFTESVSIWDKLKCIYFLKVEDYAKIFVDEVIQISVEVCDKLYKSTFNEETYEFEEIPCICGHPSYESLSSSETTRDEVQRFSGWPSINDFEIELGCEKISEFMDLWHFEEEWKHNVSYLASYSDMCSDFHFYEAMWSIPSKEYPVAQATASILCNIEVSRIKPKCCIVGVTFQYEGSKCIYKAGQFDFMEDWLFNIVDSKLNLFKTITF